MADNKKQIKQTGRFTTAELSLLKNTFAENEDLLKSMRKVFLQLPLGVADKERIAGAFKDKQSVLDVITKTFLPTLDGEAPIHQLIDLFLTVKLEEKSADQAFPIVIARTKLVQLLEQQLKVLSAVANGQEFETEINLADLLKINEKNAIEIYADLTCRNTMIGHTDMMLSQINLLAGLKDETIEQTRERLSKDSSK